MKPTKARAARRSELPWGQLATADDVRKALRDECDYEGGIRPFGRLVNVSAGHISRVLRGEKEPGPKLLEWFGLRAVTFYEHSEVHHENCSERCPGSWPIKEGGVVYCAQPKGHEGPCAPPKPRNP